MDTAAHYDLLIEENNDPFFDPPQLKEYMDLWDGQAFIDSLNLDRTKNVLEIGIGTGRLAVRTAPHCKHLTGIDISSKTIDRAKENLLPNNNISFICADFLTYRFSEEFDIIYSSLTMMHFEDKKQVVAKIDSLLKKTGVFCCSIDKNKSEFIDMGNRKLRVYPDDPAYFASLINETTMTTTKIFETEKAFIFCCSK